MELYEPFKSLEFLPNQCYLCGSQEEIQYNLVFPEWYLESFELIQKPFRLLNESYKNYEDLNIPICHLCDQSYLRPLQEKISRGFSGGYESMKKINADDLFLWVSNILYGIIHIEIRTAIEDHENEQKSKLGHFEPLAISPSLLIKFSGVHLFLQGLRVPMERDDFQPFSYWLLPLKKEEKENLFEYRDDMSTLIFSLTAKDFGFIICLQDQEMNQAYHRKLEEKLRGKELSFQEFQEFRARVFYSAYLFNPIPKYLSLRPVNHQQKFTILSEPLPQGKNNLFKPWNIKTYAQVLEAFWKPWGITKTQILENEEKPMSLFDI